MRDSRNENRLKQKRSTLVFSVCSALCLTLVKTAGGLATHSMAVLASAADSFMDLLISLVNLLALKEADRPADRSHPYGHGKIEHVAGLFQCFFMSCSVIYLVWEALRRLIEGTYLMHLGLGYGIMAFSIAVTLLVVLRIRWIAKKTQSIILETESLHYSTDILTNLGTLGVLFLVQRTGMLFWDLLFSLVIAAYLGADDVEAPESVKVTGP